MENFIIYAVSDLPDDAIFEIVIYVDYITSYCKCDQTSDLWQQLELAALELGSDFLATLELARKQLVDFNEKAVCFIWLV